MSLHKAEIAGILMPWLKRYTPPALMKDDAQAQQAEAESLLGALLKFAPHDEAGPWVRAVLDKLEYQMKTRAWPTKGELGAVCANHRRETTPATRDLTGPDMRPVAINARRMMRGEPVGESYLYGRSAVEMEDSGEVSTDTMRSYRSAAYFARKNAYGEGKARAWEAEQQRRHEEARAIWGKGRARQEAAE